MNLCPSGGSAGDLTFPDPIGRAMDRDQQTYPPV